MKMLLLNKQNKGFLIVEALISLSLITTIALGMALSLKQYAKWTTKLTKNKEELRQILNTIEIDRSKVKYQFNATIHTPIYSRKLKLKETTFEWLSYAEK